MSQLAAMSVTHTPPQLVAPVLSPTTQQMQQMPMQQMPTPQGFQYGNTSPFGSRFGRRGGGRSACGARGGGCGRYATTPFYPQPFPLANGPSTTPQPFSSTPSMQPFQQGPINGAQQNRRTAPAYLNIVKRFANMNVCFSCGFDIKDGHNSTTCPPLWRRPNHQVGFTRSNAQQYINAGYDACTRAMHKTQYLTM